MDLLYPRYSSEIQEIENRLKELSLHYTMEERSDLSEPIMMDGKTPHVGIIEILAFIDQLSNETHLWWYCGC